MTCFGIWVWDLNSAASLNSPRNGGDIVCCGSIWPRVWMCVCEQIVIIVYIFMHCVYFSALNFMISFNVFNDIDTIASSMTMLPLLVLVVVVQLLLLCVIVVYFVSIFFHIGQCYRIFLFGFSFIRFYYWKCVSHFEFNIVSK